MKKVLLADFDHGITPSVQGWKIILSLGYTPDKDERISEWHINHFIVELPSGYYCHPVGGYQVMKGDYVYKFLDFDELRTHPAIVKAFEILGDAAYLSGPLRLECILDDDEYRIDNGDEEGEQLILNTFVNGFKYVELPAPTITPQEEFDYDDES